MSELFLTILRTLFSSFQSRSPLLLQNLAFRDQLAVLQRTSLKPKLRNPDRLLWLALQRVLRRWQKGLILVQPQTVIQWHRQGFRRYWRWKSRPRHGRPPVERPWITLIWRLRQVNPTWGSRRIQAELAKLDLHVSDSTVRKDRPKRRRSSQTWRTFLPNHVKELVATDFFTVQPSVT